MYLVFNFPRANAYIYISPVLFIPTLQSLVAKGRNRTLFAPGPHGTVRWRAVLDIMCLGKEIGQVFYCFPRSGAVKLILGTPWYDRRMGNWNPIDT